MPDDWKYESLGPDEHPSSRTAARAFIDEIRTSWGFYDQADEEAWSKIPERLRKQHELLRQQRQEGVKGHTSLAAQGLYTTRFRFIHEVIQNADDATYTAEVPHLVVTAKKDRMIFESNEEGFAAKNVAALCNIGQSSKAGDNTTTGEKGLGFKSVFGVATLVHVESGHWSFSFHHSDGDDGTGMVIPTWTDNNSGSSSYVHGTRLTLEFATPTEDFGVSLRGALSNISQDFFLALRKLRKISLVEENAGSADSTRIFQRLSDVDNHSIKIRSVVNDHVSVTQFLVFKTIARNMPKSSLRRQDSTQIMIAFQVNEDGHPDIPSKGHFVYATLPVRRITGLRFIVQADFTLLPSRESLNDSTWNQRILSELPKAFASAVSTWSKHDILRYAWLQFIPHSLDGAEDCWKNVRRDIVNTLAQCPIIESRLKTRLQRPTDVRSIPTSFTCDGDPLLKDLPGHDVYISKGYGESDYRLLREIGVAELSEDEMYARILADARTAEPRFKQKPFRDDWHMAFLSKVNALCRKPRLRDSLRGLDIIPLSTGQWRSPSNQGQISLPYVELDEGRRSDLPANLNLHKLHPDACCDQDPDFERFYCTLGVERCTAAEVVSDILKVHQSYANLNDSTLSAWRKPGLVTDWILHYEILFWQGYSASNGRHATLMGIKDPPSILMAKQLYFRSTAPYDAFTILKAEVQPNVTTKSGYGFMHASYETSTMNGNIRYGKSWTTWLEQVAGIRYYPPLFQTALAVAPDKHDLHPHLRYIASNRAHDFVEMLQAHWNHSYRSSCKPEYTKIVKKISETMVPNTCGIDHEVQRSILPTEEILALTNRYDVTKHLPLLKLSATINKVDEDAWTFLQRFGVLCKVDKVFMYRILAGLSWANHSADKFEQYSLEIFSRLNTVCSLDDRDWLQDMLNKSRMIFVPAESPVKSSWVSLTQCVWDGPSALDFKIVLRSRYQENPVAQKFFQDLLALPDATDKDILNDLLTRSAALDNLESTLDKCRQLYLGLASLIKKGADLEIIRANFRQSKLIYASGCWHTSSSCVWNGHLSTLQSLQASYPSLQSFFVKDLKIEVVTTKVVLTELLKASSKEPANVAVLKGLIMALSATLVSAKDRELIKDSHKELKDCSFLPVRHSSVMLAKIGDDFQIIDNQRLGDALKGRLRFLDLTREELTIAEPLLQLLNLGHRYLSRNVETRFNAKDPQLDERLSEHLRYRAYAMSRCAVAHRSPRYLRQSDLVHNMMLHCNVYTSKQINAQLVVSQSGKEVSVPNDRPAIDLQEKDGTLSIFVPYDDEALTSCVRTELPRHLMRFLGIQASDAAKQLLRILTEDDEKLDEVLEQEDLPIVTWLQPPTPHSLRTTIFSSDTGSTQRSQPSGSTLSAVRPTTAPAPAPATSAPLESGVIHVANRVEPVVTQINTDTPPPAYQRASHYGQTAEIRDSTDDRPLTFQSTNLLRRVLDENSYEKFLSEIVVPQATQNGRVVTRLLSSSKLANFDFHKIGAAGELFVFERLRSLELPQFTADNWKSSIRTLVNVVPEYSFHPWASIETADLEYADTSGDFENFLRSKSSNDFPQWDDSQTLCTQFGRMSLKSNGSNQVTTYPDQGPPGDQSYHNVQDLGCEPIKYLIEVKTTPGRCETPFFVSTKQYGYMEQYRLQPGTRPRVVYVIVRVYNLFSDDIKFKVFVDPWTLKRSGVLRFTTDRWTVYANQSGLPNGS